MAEKRTLEIELSPLEWRRLELLCGQLNHRDGSSFWNAHDLAGQLLTVAMEGARRSGSWERGVLERIVRPFAPFAVYELQLCVTRWKTAGGQTINWLGELVNAEGLCLRSYDGQPTRDAAVLAVLQSGTFHSAMQAGRTVLFDVPALTAEQAAEESDETSGRLMLELGTLYAEAATGSEFSRQLDLVMQRVTERLPDHEGLLPDDWRYPCGCEECLSQA